MNDLTIHCNGNQLLPLSQFTPHPKNPNKHDKSQIDRLAKLFQYHGIRHPIIISKRTGYIVAGHGRLLAAKKLGLKEFPVEYQDFENADAEYAFLVADNAIADWAELDLSAINALVPELGPDFDIDWLGIKDFEIEPADKFNGDEDAVPEVGEGETRVKLGDLWQLGEHRLLCGDCTVKENVERLMGGERADMVFTSPPYSDQRDYTGGMDLSPFHLAKSLLLPAKIYVVNLGYQRKCGEVFRYWDDWIHSAATQELKLLSWNIWDRKYPASIAQQTAMFPIEHEWIFVFGKETIELNRTVENKYAGQEIAGSSNREKDGSMTKSRARECHSHRPIGTITRCDIHRGDSPHPAMYPVELPEQYILAVPGELVADPFLGSGSTLIACEKTGRKCYGMEIDPHYCDVILKRWEQFTGKQAVKIG